MSKQSLIIYKIPVLFNILNEIKENFNFDLLNFEKEENIKNLNRDNSDYFVVLTNLSNEIKNQKNQIIIDNFPYKINSIVEKVNLALLKQKYNFQSEILINNYKLDINSREILNSGKKVKLTEREIDIILFLKNSNEPKSIDVLQKEVWGHNSVLETHTVETHIYRLRKKIKDGFQDDNFIISTKGGYKI